MIDGKRVLALIPARGGSKGVRRKNVRVVCGRPLIAWTIEEARKSAYIDRLVLSSEDAEIIDVARQWGCEAPFVRPVELAADETPGIDPVLDALDRLPGFDFVALLQPTSPLRSFADIDGALQACVRSGANACVSVTEAEESPYWMYSLSPEHRLLPVIPCAKLVERRQELPSVYSLNGAVYVAHCEWLRETRSFLTEDTIGYAMPRERSLDIDTELDLELLRMTCQERTNEALQQNAGR